MPDLITFEPLFADQDEDTILDRWRGWANEGLTVESDPDRWTDTREGSHWWTATTGGRREAARIYDTMGTEVIAAAFPQYSWGERLDDHAELRQVGRLSATVATGTLDLTGDAGTVVNAGTVFAAVPVVEGGPDAEYVTAAAVTLDGSGLASVAVRARLSGEVGNAPGGVVTDIVSVVPGLETVTNPLPMTGGTDPETDDALRPRVIETFAGTGVANAAYYRRLGLNHPGIGRVTVRRAAPDSGHIILIVSTADGQPVSSDVIDSFQAEVDPDGGEGGGLGQTGAEIEVQTASTLSIVVVAQLELEPGYSIDGAGGTVPVRGAVQNAVAAYIDTVESGDEVVYRKVLGRVVGITGVHDVPVLTVNTGTVDVPVPINPPQVVSLSLPMTLTEV